MKKIFAIVLLLSLCLSLVGCDKYYSSYSALASVRSNTADKAYLSFASLNGRMVFKLRPSEKSVLKYDTELGEGRITVSYDTDGAQKELISLTGEDAKVGDGITVDKGITVYVIVDAESAKNGKITVNLEETE